MKTVWVYLQGPKGGREHTYCGVYSSKAKAEAVRDDFLGYCDAHYRDYDHLIFEDQLDKLCPDKS